MENMRERSPDKIIIMRGDMKQVKNEKSKSSHNEDKLKINIK